ncbi:hypothetical protein GCM10008916_12820 [Clostridium nitritogenes]|uniref:Uncharacterized protein n=1 Tax=Clostridium nitritogenes TaxID=83340 RepID=A0ABN1LM79_9CLOT
MDNIGFEFKNENIELKVSESALNLIDIKLEDDNIEIKNKKKEDLDKVFYDSDFKTDLKKKKF